MSFHVDGVFMTNKPERLENISENIKEKFNISDSGKVKKFLGVYYEFGHDAKRYIFENDHEKYAKKIVESHEKYTGSDFKVQKTPGALGTTLIKSDLEEPDNVDKYR